MKALPLVDYASQIFEETSLSDCYIVGVQHILPTTLYMLRKLFAKGLKPENVSLLGKCYSTNLDAYQGMKEIGVDVSEYSLAFDSHASYDDQFVSYVQKFIKERLDKITSSSFKKVIVIDDGGHMIDELLKLTNNDLTKNIVGIEQTSSGYNILKNKNLNIPIINLARSHTKLNLEPEKIVKNACLKIFEYIQNKQISINKILICGNGSVGSQIKTILSNEYEVYTYDVDTSRSDFTKESLKIALKEFDLIIGATGSTSLTKEFHPYLKQGVVLASVSSSDREFDSHFLRKKVNAVSTSFQHLLIDGIHLLNCGFPVNFNNSNVDDPYFFQLIRALIIKSILQAIRFNQEASGFLDLCNHSQKRIYDRFIFITRNYLKIKGQRERINIYNIHSNLNSYLCPIYRSKFSIRSVSAA